MGKRCLKSCMKCGKLIKNFKRDKDNNIICYNCYLKTVQMINSNPRVTFQDAISRVYEVKGSGGFNKKKGVKYLRANLNLPQILIGHKVRLVLADDNRQIQNNDVRWGKEVKPMPSGLGNIDKTADNPFKDWIGNLK